MRSSEHISIVLRRLLLSHQSRMQKGNQSDGATGAAAAGPTLWMWKRRPQLLRPTVWWKWRRSMSHCGRLPLLAWPRSFICRSISYCGRLPALPSFLAWPRRPRLGCPRPR